MTQSAKSCAKDPTLRTNNARTGSELQRVITRKNKLNPTPTARKKVLESLKRKANGTIANFSKKAKREIPRPRQESKDAIVGSTKGSIELKNPSE
jgi:hypothetical protein